MARLLLLIMIVFSVNAYAEEIVDDHDISNISSCWKKWSEDNADFSMTHSCLKQENKLSDARLNKVYCDAARFIEQYPRMWHQGGCDVEQLNMLKDSQRAWMKFRDNECTLILSNEDTPNLNDPHAEATWLSCMIIQTNSRTRQLQLYFNSEDFYPSPLLRGSVLSM